MFEVAGVYYEQNGNVLTVQGVSENWEKDTLTLTDEVNGIPVTAIAAYAFENVHCLKKVAIPRTVEKIGDKAFHNCLGLREVVFFRKREDEPINLGYQVFQSCKNLIGVRGSARLKLNGEYVFYGCSSLENMPTSIYGKIRTGTFSKCPKLRTTFFNYVTEIDDMAFDEKNVIETVVVMNDFKCSDKFWRKLKEAKVMCRQSSRFSDLSYEGYRIVLTSK